MAKGSGLSLDQCKVLNGMETIRSLIRSAETMASCAFISIPASKTEYNATLLGRNYDFSPPYDKCAEQLTVTILNEENSVPTAIISMPGQIYCPTCINANGLFLEFNNGMPSGGYYVDTSRKSILINMLEILQDSGNVDQIDKQLRATETDYSVITNIANAKSTKSYEISSTMGMKSVTPSDQLAFVSTNFYLNETWNNIPKPSDSTTWLGVTRRNNLLNLANVTSKFNISKFKQLMDTPIEQGGAVWNMTIYQIIFDTNDLSLYLKANNLNGNWTHINLSEQFAKHNSNEDDSSHDVPYYYVIIGSVGGLLLGCLCYPIAKKLCSKNNTNEQEPDIHYSLMKEEKQTKSSVANTKQTVFADSQISAKNPARNSTRNSESTNVLRS